MKRNTDSQEVLSHTIKEIKSETSVVEAESKSSKRRREDLMTLLREIKGT